MKFKLTKIAIDSIQPTNTDIFIWDVNLPGFYVVVRPSGRKSFYAIYRLRNRKQQKVKLGDFPVITVETARERYKELTNAAFNGYDPLQQIKDRLLSKNNHTIIELCEKYMKEYAMIHKKPSSIASDKNYWKLHILPKIGNRTVTSITRSDVLEIHNGVAKELNLNGKFKTTTANHVLELLSKAFNLAEDWEWRGENTNPCRKIKKFPEVPRRRYLSVQECIKLYQVLSEYVKNENYRARQVAYFIFLLLYTGARRGEIITAKWSYIIPERYVLALPDTKANKPQDIQLSNEAFDVLNCIRNDQNNNGFKSEYIFNGRSNGQPLSSEDYHWHNIRKKAELIDFHLHDLRHSFASFMAMTTGSQIMIKEALRHSNTRTSDRYTHMFNTPLRMAINKTTSQIHKIMKEGNTSNFKES